MLYLSVLGGQDGGRGAVGRSEQGVQCLRQEAELDLKGKSSVTKSPSRSARAGLQFSVGRVSRYLRKGRYAARVGGGAPVYLAGWLIGSAGSEIPPSPEPF